MTSRSIKQILIFCFVVSVVSLYSATLAPGITWANWGADGGDYLSALHTGGISHPTGYPTYLLAAKSIYLIPFGSLAWRGNLFSAVSMALSGTVLLLMLWKLFPKTWWAQLGAFLAAFFFTLSPLVWSQAVITEVYGLHALFFSVMLYILFTRGPLTKRGLLLAGLLLGLGLGNHVTLAILLPPFLLFSPTARPEKEKTKDNVLASYLKQYAIIPKLLGILTGASVYGTLLIYAASASPVRWLNPTGLGRFWELLSGQMYHSYWGLPAGETIIAKVLGTLGILYQQVSWIGMLLLALGVVMIVREKIPVWGITLWIIFASLFFSIGYQTEDSAVYLIPAILCMSIWIAYGILFACNWLITKSLSPALLMILLIPSLVLHGRISYQLADASRDFRAIDYGQRVIREAPQNAMIFTKKDKEAFALWYFQYVEGQRPDLAIIITPFLRYDWYLEVLAQAYPGLALSPSAGALTRADLEESNNRPGCSTYPLSSIVLSCSP